MQTPSPRPRRHRLVPLAAALCCWPATGCTNAPADSQAATSAGGAEGGNPSAGGAGNASGGSTGGAQTGGTAGQGSGSGGTASGGGGLPNGGSAGASGASGASGSGGLPGDRTPEGVCARWNADHADTSEGIWSGSRESCDPGDISADGRANALRLLNLHRWLADLPAVETDP